MNNELDIKPVQTWLRRDGGKFRCYATDGSPERPVHGAYETRNGWMGADLGMNGRYYSDGRRHDFDLIRLYDWREELAPIWAALHPRFTCCAMNEDRSWFCYQYKPPHGAKSYATIGNGGCERMDNLFNMPTPDCPWYETLTMRPEA